MFRYIDIHSHTNFAAFDTDRDTVVRRVLDAGVAFITVGTQKDTSRRAVEIAEKYEKGVYAIVGIHPIHTSKSFHDAQELGEGNREFTSRGEVFDYDYYKQLATHPKVVGIGECGLDYYRENEDSGFKIQEKAFRQQIELAIEVKKPLMLHLRNGGSQSVYSDAFSILSTFNFPLETGRRPGNLHFFAGSVGEARPFLDAGFTFSFTGVITFAKEYEEIIRYLPLDAILSETDSPYVAPVPIRGKRNEPLYVREVVKAIARIRHESKEKVRAQIQRNAEQLFSVSLA